jgi:serine protease Do
MNRLLALLLLAPALPAQLTPAQLERDTPIARVVRDIGPAVVNVYQLGPEVELPRWQRQFFGQMTTRQSSLGSGFLIDPDGYILTNAHVLELGTQGIFVRLPDKSEFPAEVVNIDPDNDVALLKITPPPGMRLPAVRLGTSSDLMVGETIIAIGNPLGNENSVSSGIVSAVFREVPVPTLHGGQGAPVLKETVQVDAAINPGNSGGPLLNVLGEVVGINFMVAEQAENIGFAIPIDRVRDSLVQTLMNPTLKSGVSAGLQMQGDPQTRAVTLAAVEPDGSAARAGLRNGDRLVSIAGKPVQWEFDVNKALVAANPGDRVDVVVERDGREVRTALELERDESPMQVIWRRMGLSVVDHPRFKGVRVERVDPVGPAAPLGLQTGDLVDGLGEREVDSAADLYALLQSLPSGEKVVVHVWRGRAASYGQLQLQ